MHCYGLECQHLCMSVFYPISHVIVSVFTLLLALLCKIRTIISNVSGRSKILYCMANTKARQWTQYSIRIPIPIQASKATNHV